MQPYTKSDPKRIYPLNPPKFSFGTSEIELLKNYKSFEKGDRVEMQNNTRYQTDYPYTLYDGDEHIDIDDVTQFQVGIDFKWI